MDSGAGPLRAGATLRRADPPPQGRARGPARLASASQDGRAAAVRGGPRRRSDPPRLRRQAAPDRTRCPGALPVLRQAVLPRVLRGGLSALRSREAGGLIPFRASLGPYHVPKRTRNAASPLFVTQA